MESLTVFDSCSPARTADAHVHSLISICGAEGGSMCGYLCLH